MNKTWMRILALLTAVMISVSCTALADDDDPITFSTTLVDAMDYSRSDWMKDETNRALVTVLLMVAALAESGLSADDYTITDSVVAYSDETICIAICGTKDTLIIFYTPSVKFGQYTKIGKVTKSQMYTIMKDTNTMAYENSASAISTVLDMLMEAFNDQ